MDAMILNLLEIAVDSIINDLGENKISRRKCDSFKYIIIGKFDILTNVRHVDVCGKSIYYKKFHIEKLLLILLVFRLNLIKAKALASLRLLNNYVEPRTDFRINLLREALEITTLMYEKFIQLRGNAAF